MATNQVVLVTGASTGFGRLFTETLARKGYTVFATMRGPKGKNAKNAAEIESLAKKESLPIHILELDVTKDDSVDKAFKAAIDKAGRIDVVINNAGFPVVGLMETITVEQAQSQFDTNFFGCVRVNRAALPHMRKQIRTRSFLRSVQLRTRRTRYSVGKHPARRLSNRDFWQCAARLGQRAIGNLRSGEPDSTQDQRRTRQERRQRAGSCRRGASRNRNAGGPAQGALSRQPARHRGRCLQRSLRKDASGPARSFRFSRRREVRDGGCRQGLSLEQNENRASTVRRRLYSAA